MQQRLSLAVSLLGSPRVLVLDEPGNGLDPDGICWLRNFLIGFARDGNSVLLSSHLLGEVAKTVDEVVFLNRRVMGRRAVSSLEQGQDLEQLFVNVVHAESRS